VLNLHTLFIGQREREKETERESAGLLNFYACTIFMSSPFRERERKREGEGERERERIVILKGMVGALAPFSYLVLL
jgi:hypothetical protein